MPMNEDLDKLCSQYARVDFVNFIAEHEEKIIAICTVFDTHEHWMGLKNCESVDTEKLEQLVALLAEQRLV